MSKNICCCDNDEQQENKFYIKVEDIEECEENKWNKIMCIFLILFIICKKK